jgi:2,4-dienoyl-CoA reductase-like NADH-dependent reductase (Old Yellow Enzyme family)
MASEWFSPITIRGIQLPSRVMLAPINTGFVHDGLPTARMIDFHARRSGPAIGVSMVGNVAVNENAGTNPSTAVLNSKISAAAFSELAIVITRMGSVAGIQLANSPAMLAPRRSWKVLDIPQEIRRLRRIISAFSVDELRRVADQFVTSSQLAVGSGFQVVQLHAAHGYLLSLLLTTEANIRDDEFGHSATWFEELIGRIRMSIGDAILSVRLSALRGLSAVDEEMAWTRAVSTRAVQAGADIIDYSAGLYTVSRRMIYPGREYAAPVYLEHLPDICGNEDHLIAVAGRLSLDKLGMFQASRTLVNVGRPLLADSAYCDKWRLGEGETVRACILSNRCHYFSRGLSHIECGVNPQLSGD